MMMIGIDIRPIVSYKLPIMKILVLDTLLASLLPHGGAMD